MSEDRAEETEASYPDSGSVRDSKEGGSDELEEVEDGVGKGGQKQQTGAPLPKHLGHVVGNLCGVSSVWGLVWQYQVLVDLVSPIVIVTRSLTVSSLVYALGICPFDTLSLMWSPCFCLGKYLLIWELFL